MKREGTKAIRDAAEKIYKIIEKAEAHLPEAERAARWERFMRSTDAIAERREKRPARRRTPASRAASHAQ